MANFTATSSNNLINLDTFSFNAATVSVATKNFSASLSNANVSFDSTVVANVSKNPLPYSYSAFGIRNLVDTNGRPVRGQIYPR